MRETELKAIVDDLRERRARVEAAGGALTFAGRLEDTRYDRADRAMLRQDHVLRLRVYRDAGGTRGYLDWKGPTEKVDGYKVREELSAGITDPEVLATILDKLGYSIVREIDREIAQYDWNGVTIRFERYPRMDTLVEVEGVPDAIEAAIEMLAMPRAAFTSDRLADFILAYETRTGVRAAVCDRELSGDFRYSIRGA